MLLEGPLKEHFNVTSLVCNLPKYDKTTCKSNNTKVDNACIVAKVENFHIKTLMNDLMEDFKVIEKMSGNQSVIASLSESQIMNLNNSHNQ